MMVGWLEGMVSVGRVVVVVGMEVVAVVREVVCGLPGWKVAPSHSHSTSPPNLPMLPPIITN